MWSLAGEDALCREEKLGVVVDRSGSAEGIVGGFVFMLGSSSPSCVVIAFGAHDVVSYDISKITND